MSVVFRKGVGGEFCLFVFVNYGVRGELCLVEKSFIFFLIYKKNKYIAIFYILFFYLNFGYELSILNDIVISIFISIYFDLNPSHE